MRTPSCTWVSLTQPDDAQASDDFCGRMEVTTRENSRPDTCRERVDCCRIWSGSTTESGGSPGLMGRAGSFAQVTVYWRYRDLEKVGKGEHKNEILGLDKRQLESELMSDGISFEGDFVQDQKSGQGAEKWPDGTMYAGEFYNDLKNGKGLMVWPDGDRYSHCLLQKRLVNIR